MLPYQQTGFVKYVHLEGMYFHVENSDVKRLSGLLFYLYLCGMYQVYELSR